MSDEFKVYPLMLRESTMKKLQEAAVAKNKKVEDIIEGFTYQLKTQPKKPEPPKRKEGWFRPGSSRKFHYFVDGRSLCGGWGFPNYSELDADTGNTEPQKEDCAACFRKLVKRRAELKVEKIE